MTVAPFTLRWSAREPPLPPAAVAGSGRVAASLAAAAHDRVGAGAELRAAARPDWIVVLADAADLPWADGAVYLGWDGGLLAPTTLAPWPPAGVIRGGLAGHAPDGCDLLVLLPDRLLVAPMPVRPLNPTALATVTGG
jgi:MoxR-vWA-beta-propeller ternary system domain bpX5